MFANIRKYREVLGLLLLLAAAAVTFFAHHQDPDDLGPVFGRLTRVVLAAEAPLERGLNASVGLVVDRWQSYVALRQVRQENLALHRQLLTLDDQLEVHRQLAQENQRLRDLLHFSDTARLRTLTAAVIGDSLAPAALSRVIRIGVGRGAGVERGMAVVSALGAVGRVQQVYPNSSDVQLVQDPASAVAVRVERSRARANVVGTGRDHRAKLEYALRSDDIEEGDSLVTSGTDGVFPPGLAVGKVVEVQRKTSATFLRAQVVPAIDPRQLEEVFVVLAQAGSLESLPAAQN